MAAFIGWVDANVGNTPQKRGQVGLAAGGMVREFVQSWAKKTTDGNSTIYFVSEISSDALITSLLLNNDALAGATSADLGIYRVDPSQQAAGVNQTAATYFAGYPTSGTPSGTNAWVDAGAIFMSATDIHSAAGIGSEVQGLSNLSVETVTTLGATTNGLLNFALKIWQLLGIPDPKWKDDSYVVGLRLNTAGSAAGNLVLRGRYIHG